MVVADAHSPESSKRSSGGARPRVTHGAGASFRPGALSGAKTGARLAIGGAVCAALVLGGLSPVWAAEAPQGPPTVQLGSFAVGDGLQAVIDERDGSASLAISVGGVGVTWDSRAAGVNRSGLGYGWNIGVARIERNGGVRVWPASGGVFEADANQPSGLSGYTRGDVVFRAAEPGAMIEGRADGVVAAQPYSYTLEELGGVITYFNADGDPIVKLERDRKRTDWTWADDGSSRLRQVVNVDGVVTTLDWSDDAVEIRPGANAVAAKPGDGVGGVWRIEFGSERLVRVADPSGAGTAVRYGPDGLIAGLDAHSGASADLTWQVGDDRVVRADTVRVLDVDGGELSRREWRSSGIGTASGWPAVGSGGLTAATAAYSTTLFDGATRIESTYDPRHTLTNRSVIAKTAAGDQLVQEQEYTFPGSGSADSARATQPTGMTVTYHDSTGASRTGTESYEYDEFGRMVRRESADGTVTTREFDAVLPDGGALPIGLPVSETTIAPDGLVSTTTSELSADRRDVLATEDSTTKPGGSSVVTGRTEYAVEGGRVVEERQFPSGDESAAPLVTTWDEVVDLAAGIRTITETVAAGTDVASTSRSVSSLVHGGGLELTDAAGVHTSTTYDQVGREVSTTDGAGRSVTTEYGEVTAGGVSSMTVLRSDGVAMTEEYDELGRPLRTFDNIGPKGKVASGYERVIETHAYPEPGVEEITDAWGRMSRVETDLFGRHSRTILPTGLVQVSEYDDVAGTATAWSSPTGRVEDAESTTTKRFDDSGRTVATTGERADGVAVPEVTGEFDGLGRATASDDGVVQTRVEYDDLGRPAETTTTPIAGLPAGETNVPGVSEPGGFEPVGLHAARRFDGFGVSVEKTMSSAEESRSGGTRELDALGRTVLEVDQAGAAKRYEYEPDGLVRRVTTDDGRTTTYTYDDDTRALLTAEFSSPDRATVATEYEYDERGRLSAVFDPADEAGTRISYEYDDFGNTTLVQYPAEREGEPGKQIRHEYDEHGRKMATTDVAGNRTDLGYDDVGQLISTVQSDANGELARAEYAYDDLARIVEVRRGNGVVTAITYTSANQIASEVTTKDGLTQSERSYEYEAARGNLIARIDRTGDGAVVTRTEYRYDTLDRLVSSTVRDGDTADAPALSSTEYDLTVGGDVAVETRTTDPGTDRAATTVRRFGFSPIGELVSIETTSPDRSVQVQEREFDASGNLVRGADGTRFAWDAANRQISETRTDGTVIATEYWADGSRKALRTADASTTFYWDGTSLLNDAHESADVAAADGVAGYLLGVQRQARTTRTGDGGTDTAYYSTDRHGNVTELTDTSGAITTEYAYSDYGVVTAPSGVSPEAVAALPGGVGELDRNPIQYSSEYTHEDGTQFLRTRILDPGLMSFRSKDREALQNLFAYAEGNPIMRVDPSGRDWAMDYLPVFLTGIGLLGAFVGAGAAFLTLAVATSKSMALLGAVALTYGIVDAGWTGAQAASIAMNTKFMPDDVAIGVGATIAGMGVLLGLGGVVGGFRTVAKGPKLNPGTVLGTEPYGGLPQASGLPLKRSASQPNLGNQKQISTRMSAVEFEAKKAKAYHANAWDVADHHRGLAKVADGTISTSLEDITTSITELENKIATFKKKFVSYPRPDGITRSMDTSEVALGEAKKQVALARSAANNLHADFPQVPTGSHMITPLETGPASQQILVAKQSLDVARDNLYKAQLMVGGLGDDVVAGMEELMTDMDALVTAFGHVRRY